MINGRYIEVPAVPDGNRLVPLWDCDVVFQYGAPWLVEHEGKRLDARKVIEALYDIETKEVSLNVRIVWKEPAKYSVGQRVGVDVGGHTLRVMEITDVQDGREELRVSPGSELRGWTELFQEDKDGLTQIDPKGLEASKVHVQDGLEKIPVRGRYRRRMGSPAVPARGRKMIIEIGPTLQQTILGALGIIAFTLIMFMLVRTLK